MNIESVKTTIQDAGFKIQKGIGSQWEFFVSDGEVAITCYATPCGDFEAYSSDEDSDGFSINAESEIISVLKTAFAEEYEFLENGGEQNKLAF